MRFIGLLRKGVDMEGRFPFANHVEHHLESRGWRAVGPPRSGMGWRKFEHPDKPGHEMHVNHLGDWQHRVGGKERMLGGPHDIHHYGLAKSQVGDYERKNPKTGATEHVGGYQTVDHWKPTQGPAAATHTFGGGWHEDEHGQKWWVKQAKDDDHLKTEYAANKLYDAAGVKVPEGRLVTKGGKLHYASRMIEGAKPATLDEAAENTHTHRGFPADAWLGNYDAVGMPEGGAASNMLATGAKPMQVIHRIDHGGSLHRRAQGGMKDFGPEVKELASMKDPKITPHGSKVFSATGPASQIKAAAQRDGARAVADIPAEKIRSIIGSAQFDPKRATELYKTLLARQKDVAKKLVPDHPLAKSYDGGMDDELSKSHVKGYWKKDEKGGMSFVRDHDDSRHSREPEPVQEKPAFTGSEQAGSPNAAGSQHGEHGPVSEHGHGDDPAAVWASMSAADKQAAAKSHEERLGKIKKLNQLDGVEVWKRGDASHGSVNDIPLKPAKKPDDWTQHSEGQHPHFEEPPLEHTPGFGNSAGVITVEPDGRVWVVEPRNHFGGYEHTFPKGGVEKEKHAIRNGDQWYVGGGHEKKDAKAPGWTKDRSKAREFGSADEAGDRLKRVREKGWLDEGAGQVHTTKGLSLQQTAQKELHEEAGLKSEIVGHLGDYHRSTTNTRYYVGVRTGGHPGDTDDETHATKLVPHEHLDKFLNHPKDKEIAGHLKELIGKAMDAGDGDLHGGLRKVMGEGQWKPKMPDAPRPKFDSSTFEASKGKPKILGASLQGASWAPKPKKGTPAPGKSDVPNSGTTEPKQGTATPHEGETIKEKLARLFLWKSHAEPAGAVEKGQGRRLHFRTEFQGLPVSIENRRGSWRQWHDPMTGQDGQTKMQHHYGYIRLTEGADGDQVDCFIGPNPDATQAYVVRQVNPETGEYDEDKCMLGFDSADEARDAYLAHYDDPRFYGYMVTMPMALFRARVKETKGAPGPVKTHDEMALKDVRATAATMSAGPAQAYA